MSQPTALARVPAPTAMTASSACSKALWRQLTDDRTFTEACTALVAQPEAVRELENVVHLLEREAGPCGRDGVIRELMRLAPVFGISDRSKGEWATFYSAYGDVLSDLPLPSLKAGIAAYMRSPEAAFFPKPGPLRALCLKAPAAPEAIALARAKRVLRLAHGAPPPARRPASPGPLDRSPINIALRRMP